MRSHDAVKRTERNLTQPRTLQFPTFTRQLRYNERDWLTLKSDADKSDADGSDTRSETYGYDGRGRRKSLLDPHGKTSAYEYNVFGEVTQAKDALGHTVNLLRDARGNVLQVTTDPRGNTTRSSYDEADNLTGCSGGTV